VLFPYEIQRSAKKNLLKIVDALSIRDFRNWTGKKYGTIAKRKMSKKLMGAFIEI